MLIWKRSAHNVMRCDGWRIVRFPWSNGATYILWHHSSVLGTYTSAEDAKNAAESHQNGLQAAISA
jgi:hypothetical protein